MADVVVLNGSPKGDVSVTMQYVHYLEKMPPERAFTYLNVAQKAPRLERDTAAFDAAIDQIQGASIVLWAFPLYYMLVHGNYKRFIELVWERGAAPAFEGKYTATLSTSIHFFDHTAHAYVRANAEDLGMRVTGSFSADVGDLFDADKRQALLSFGRELLDAAGQRAPTPRRFAPLNACCGKVEFSGQSRQVDARRKRIVILTDAEPHQANLMGMIDQFRSAISGPSQLVNLNDVDIKGGCLGCLRCGYDNHCAYEGKDGYVEMHREQLQTADVLVFAGAIRDRFLSATWKTFYDRSFFSTHTPSLAHKQIGFIVSGPLSQIANLQEILQAWTEIQGSNFAGFVSDEYGDAAHISELLVSLARRLIRGAEARTQQPITFLGVGGLKLFRDDIWGRLRTTFRADHRAYKRLRLYDFPQRDLRTRAINAVTGLLLRVPALRKVYVDNIREGMVRPIRSSSRP